MTDEEQYGYTDEFGERYILLKTSTYQELVALRTEVDKHIRAVQLQIGLKTLANVEAGKWRECAEKLADGLQFYADFALGKNHQPIFDAGNYDRASVYEEYKKYSIGDLGVRAVEVLKHYEEMKARE